MKNDIGNPLPAAATWLIIFTLLIGIHQAYPNLLTYLEWGYLVMSGTGFPTLAIAILTNRPRKLGT